MLATGATTPPAPGGAQEGGRRQTEGGDKPPSLAGSRRCSWAFRQDRARMSSPGRGRERVLTAHRSFCLSFHQS